MLATRCDRLLSSGIIPSALSRPKPGSEGSHTSGSRNAPFRRSGRLGPSTSWSSVRSRYFEDNDLGRMMTCVMETTVRGAHVVGVHWRGETNYPLSGDRAHEIIARTPGPGARSTTEKRNSSWMCGERR